MVIQIKQIFMLLVLLRIWGQNGRLRGRHGHSTLDLPEQDQQTGETAEVMLM